MNIYHFRSRYLDWFHFGTGPSWLNRFLLAASPSDTLVSFAGLRRIQAPTEQPPAIANATHLLFTELLDKPRGMNRLRRLREMSL
jgi:hypothetical protein